MVTDLLMQRHKKCGISASFSRCSQVGNLLGNRWSQGGVDPIGGGLHSECLTNMNIEETIRDWAKSGRIARGSL